MAILLEIRISLLFITLEKLVSSDTIHCYSLGIFLGKNFDTVEFFGKPRSHVLK